MNEFTRLKRYLNLHQLPPDPLFLQNVFDQFFIFLPISKNTKCGKYGFFE